MATNEFLKASLEHYRQQHQRKLEELRALDTTIRQIEMDLGEEPKPQHSLAHEGRSSLADASPGTGIYTPRPDEFFGMSQSDAAKAFLEKKKQAVSLEELVQGLKSGGCKVGGVDPKKTLYISLVRNVREFVPVGKGYIGLRKFYPNSGRAGQKTKPEIKRRSRKVRVGRSAGVGRQAANPPSKPDHAGPQSRGEVGHLETKVAARTIMADHVLRTPDELMRAIELRLGRKVKKITVYGILRNRDFEGVGDKYRMRLPNEGRQQNQPTVN